MTSAHWAQVSDRSLEWLVTSGLRVVLIAVAMFLLMALLRRAVARILRTSVSSRAVPSQVKRTTTLTNILRDVARIAIVFVGALMILAEVGIDLRPLLAAVGVGGLALGFGAQSLVKDLIAGFFILLEDSVRVGDIVEVAGVSGVVEKVELRAVTLRGLSGDVHVIPNGIIDKVTNKTQEFSCYVFETGVAYAENVDHVMAVLREVAEELRGDVEFRGDILAPLEMLGVDQFADSAVIIKSRITTVAGQQWRVGREMNRRIKNTFDARGIEIPFPHRTLYWGEPKGKETTGLRPEEA